MAGRGAELALSDIDVDGLAETQAQVAKRAPSAKVTTTRPTTAHQASAAPRRPLIRRMCSQAA
ncbi:MAG TPA: hypothetical protein PL196_05270 [Burkholderiaceae bacterium]|nr:hypothetical protein [Burkholderiaceae bacterium]